ncbi:TetR/AcrR family transcriptional regulator [Amaricoccus solimangrovi]|uniref:TetR/AcrR family transcriptional regulator n=1 Tax=Amaricoccus solimangrovi TaxID=2589815 RepID=A0A501WUW8_9RHOB|nr:TetR/AcrR family transcriptional regulator [Amaricoccus solimangrovi]TPE53543.1 TetR/AcrR family transcriptional regulator [Amaricoccus solimangrovi]
MKHEPTIPCDPCAGGAMSRAERGEQKCAQVLAGARQVFLSDGYEGASVDDIARSAGISKATLYRHFPDKAALFSAVLAQECRTQANLHPELGYHDRPIAEFLLDLARDVLNFSLGEFGQSIYRIAVGETARFPDIGRTFYDTGSEMNRTRLAPALDLAVKRGELVDLDPDYAAHVFYGICKADLFHRRLFRIGDPPDAEEIERHARRTVETFLRAFGRRD